MPLNIWMFFHLNFSKLSRNYLMYPRKAGGVLMRRNGFSLGLSFINARAYNLLSKLFAPPSTRMLRHWAQRLNLESPERGIFNNGINYMTGNVCHKLFKSHDCVKCKAEVTKESGNDIYNDDRYFRNEDLGQNQYLCYPIVVDIVNDSEQIFSRNVRDIICQELVRKEFKRLMQIVNCENLKVCDGIIEKIIDIYYLKMHLHCNFVKCISFCFHFVYFVN